MNNKVLFILSIPPPYGGGEIVSQLLYNSIHKDFNCIAFSRTNYSKSKQGNKNIYSYFYGLYYLITVLIKLIQFRPKAIYIGLPKSFPAFIRNAIIIWIAAIFKINIYCELHGMDFPFIEKSNFKKQVLFSVLRKISKIRVLSNSIKKYIEDLGFTGKIYVINNGIKKPEGIANTQFIGNSLLNILYIGAITKNKGFSRVLEIINSLDKPLRNKIHLNVIGEFIHKYKADQFLQFIENNQLSSYITFHGRKLDKEKWQLISNNQILIHLTNFDGQPLTIIEAMSLGIPTITTRVGAIPEMINDNINGFLVNNNKEVKEIIEKLLKKEINYKEISKSAIKTYELCYTGNLMVKDILQMVEE